jgi:hypothetical protein
MTFTVELTEEQIGALKARAAGEGLSLEGWLRKIANEDAEPRRKPYKTGYGMLAKYGPAPSAEEIDENRRDMFRGFGEDF